MARFPGRMPPPSGYAQSMTTLSKPMKALLLGVALYGFFVLMFRFGRNGMPWDRALLVALAAAPVALLWGWVRDHWNDRARQAGERWRHDHRRP